MCQHPNPNPHPRRNPNPNPNANPTLNPNLCAELVSSVFRLHQTGDESIHPLPRGVAVVPQHVLHEHTTRVAAHLE